MYEWLFLVTIDLLCNDEIIVQPWSKMNQVYELNKISVENVKNKEECVIPL